MLVIWLGAGAPGALGITSALFQLVIALPMALAPSNRKHPSTTVMPRRNSDLPDSISSPIAATATTATLVATLPSAPPSTHRSEEHTSELQSLMRISYAVFGLKKQNTQIQ